ncbi:alpha/beta hydrolase [Patescibacteria group bacterium]|nr:alpha/beta hydrolase [Patescibacteria group bacterium]
MKKILLTILGVLCLILIGTLVLLRDQKGDTDEYLAYVSTLDSFETGHGTLRYRDVGEGNPILLVHGVPTSSFMYRNLADELASRGYRVIVPDLLGFGASDRLEDESGYAFDKQATTLIDLMDHLGIETWDQVTHDIGGLVTWNMVHQVPDRIEHLYLLNTILYDETFNPIVNLSPENVLHRWALGLHANRIIGKAIVMGMLRTGTNHYSFTRGEAAGYWYPLRLGAGALVHFFTHTGEIQSKLDTYRSWLIESGIPVSIIWGEDDPFLDVEAAYLLQNDMSLPDDQVIILTGKRHLVAEEAYQEIANVITNYE